MFDSDDEQQPQQQKPLPTISIGWDPEAQTFRLYFDPDEFKTWDLVLAALDSAKRTAEDARRQSHLQAMQQQAMAAAQEQHLRRTLLQR